MAAEPLRVLVYARYPSVRAGLRELLTSAGFEVLGDPGDPAPARETPADIDVYVLDLGGGGPADGQIGDPGAELADLPTVVLVDGPDDARVAGEGAAPRSWLLRDASAAELAAAVTAAAEGLIVVDPSLAPAMLSGPSRPSPDPADPALTPREHEVLRLLALGLPNKAIARELGISEHTAKFHVGALLSKLDVRSRTEAVAVAARRGLLAL